VVIKTRAIFAKQLGMNLIAQSNIKHHTPMKNIIKTFAIIFFLAWTFIALATVAGLAKGTPKKGGKGKHSTCQTYAGIPKAKRTKTKTHTANGSALVSSRAELLRDSRGFAILGSDGKPLKKGDSLPSASGFLTGN
jgi:hypothetical protein